MSKQTPNLFIILDLDPDAPWNQAEFDRKLQEKRREWSKFVQFPTAKGIQAKKNLSLIDELTTIAKDEKQRKAQATEARRFQGDTQVEKLASFNERVTLLEGKGHILEEELKRLVKDFGDILSESQIRKRLSVPIKTRETTTSTPRKPTLESSLTKRIQALLKSLGKEDLYDFLGRGRSASHLLHQEAQAIYDRMNQINKKTADITHTSELSGHCLNIFKSESERAKYDETLRLQAYESLKNMVNTIADVSKVIEAAQMEQLLNEARKNKLDLKEAESIIREHARKRGFAIVIDREVRQQQLCGYCRQLNDQAKKYCTSCGELLQEPCPKCGQMVNSDDWACGACGFAIGNRVLVKLLLNDARQTGQERDYVQAMAYLKQAQQAWPASGKDSLTKEIKALEAKIKPPYKEQKGLKRQVETAIREKRFYTAQRLLKKLKQILPVGNKDIEEYERQIEPKIRQTETKLSQARRVRGDPEQIVQIYQEALHICQDCQEAREMLAKTPPSPPQALQATKGEAVIHLTWQPSRSRGVRYAIVRKARSTPVSINDGDKLATVAGTVYDDAAAEVGIPQFYAVFADREGTPSSDGTVLSQPVMLVQDVRRLTAQVDDKQVNLHWDPPANTHEIIVVRSENGYPRSIQAGQRVPVMDKFQTIDSHVENERCYYYTVFCQFKAHSGKTLTTPGTRVEVVPQRPPQPIEALQISASGLPHKRELQFRWNPPGKGDVVLIKSQRPCGLNNGTTIPQHELVKYGKLLTIASNQARDKITQLGFYYYLPVVVFQGIGYVGQEHKYVCVDDVSDLKVQNLGHALRLQWQWPPNCLEVLVAFSTENWPQPDQTDATTIALTRAQYDLKGFFDILNPEHADYFIAVFAMINQDGEKIASSGDTKGARRRVSLMSRITIRYEIRKSWRKAYSLNLSVDGNGTLPALRLVRKQRTLPMRKHDGETILQMESDPISRKDLQFPLEKNSSRPQSYAKLFLEDDDLADTVIIRHPGRDKLKLF